MNIMTKSIFVVVAGGLIASCSCGVRRMTDEEPRARMQENLEVTAMNNVYFAFDRYDLSEAGKDVLRENAEWLGRNSEVNVKIDGRADERGTNVYNMVLGKNRAIAAANYLKALGIDEGRISTVSYGEERSVDPRHNETAWAMNRQVEFLALGSEPTSITRK